MSHPFSRALAVAVAGAALPAAAVAQGAVTVSGRVVSDGGQPLAAATIFIQSLALGATTRDDGTYSFVVPAARAAGRTVTISARRVGYRTFAAQITLTGSAVVQNFTLSANPLQLGQVVVTGAGLTTTAERLGAVRTPIDTAAITRATEPNVAQALAAKAPGVVVTAQSGDPGASSKILIRGLNTIQGSGNPLFVVDGTPINNQTIYTGDATGGTVAPNRALDLNPDDIENVEVLKSAAAAAIYGARASQGVILITTKKGRAGQVHYSLRSTLTTDDVNRSVPLQQLYDQGSTGETSNFRTNTTRGALLTSGSFGALIPAGTPTFNHSQDMFETGSLFDNVLQASGGTDRTTFFFSVGSTRQNGTVVGDRDYLRRQTYRLNASQRVTNDLQVSGNFNYIDNRLGLIQRGSNTSGITLGGWRTPATFNNRNYVDSLTGTQRSYRRPNPSVAQGLSGRGYDNPFFVIANQDNANQVGRALGNVNLTYTPATWLNVTYTLGADYTSDERLETLPKTSSTFPAGQVRRANFVTYIVDNLLNAQFSKTFRDGYETRLSLGTEFNSQRQQNNRLIGQNLIADQPFALTNVITTTPDGSGDYRALIRRESYFAQLQQSIANDLYLTGTVRNDGFSTFGQNSRRNWFPSGQLSYVFTNLFTARGALNDGKLRVAYGQTGTEPGAYLTAGNFAAGYYSVGGFGDQLFAVQNGQGGLAYNGRLAQPNLRPERQNELEGGFDVSLFRSRADLSFTLYNRVARDVILDFPLPSSSGYAVQSSNAAKIQNRGVELSVNLRAYSSKDLDLALGLQYAQNKNRVLSLSPGVNAVDLPTGGYFTGTLVSAVAPTNGKSYAVGVFRGGDFVRCRYDDPTNDINADCRAANAPDGAVYIGEDGYPVEDTQLRVIGDPSPRWTGAIRPSIRYKGLNVSGLVDIRTGGTVWNGTKGALYNFGTHNDTGIRADCPLNATEDDFACTGNMRVFGTSFTPGRSQTDPGSFAVFGPGAGMAVPIGQNWFAGLGSGFGPVSSQFMEPGGFVKLREISVGYTFTQAALKRYTGLSTVDLRVSARNLALGTRYTGVDPETNLAGAGVGARGVDYFNNPMTRSIAFTLGLNR